MNNLPTANVKLGLQKLMCVNTDDLKEGLVTFISVDEETTLLLNKMEKDIIKYIEKCVTTAYEPELCEVVIAKFEG